MYQRNGRLGISKQRVRHPSFHFIMMYIFILVDYPFVKKKGKSRVETKLLQYISGTLTYHSLSGTPRDRSLLASHHAEPHPTDESFLL